METVAELLADRADDEHPALLFEHERRSWAEMVRAAAVRAAFALDRRDRTRPFHVGVLLENVPEHLHWIGAAALARATIVSINPTRRGEELASDVRHTDCQMIVTDRAGTAQLAGLDLGVPGERIVTVDAPGFADALRPYGSVRPADVVGQAGGATGADRLFLLFTSGSTGRPKAVICTQGRMARIAGVTPGNFDIGRDTVTYLSMPLFHGNSLMANWAPVLQMGATVAMRRHFSASELLADVRRFGASYFNYVGRALSYVLATPARPDDADNPLQLGFGTEASALDRQRFSARFGCRLVESYGSSEGAIALAVTDHMPAGSMGTARPGVELAVVDPATGEECPPARFDGDGKLTNGSDAIGELVGRGAAAAFEGYYGNPAAEAERVRGEDFWSGDLAYRDEHGFFYFAGRSGDWLRVDSENFAAAPVERILARWSPVVMCAVYPVPDARTGDQVMAAIELADPASFDPGAFEAFLADQPDLGTKWAPRFVRLTRSIPLTASNKVRKAPLRAEQWITDEPVWWQPERGEPYRLMTSDDRAALLDEFAAHGRTGLLPAGQPTPLAPAAQSAHAAQSARAE